MGQSMRHFKITNSLVLISAHIVLANSLVTSCLADDLESVETIVSSVVRREGYRCDKPIYASKDEADSVPEEMAWFLKCKNATYKVKLLPHYLSEIEIIEIAK
jgi:hypothetical protein